MPIPAYLKSEALVLLRGGHLSQRKIAKRLGISRGTVDAIARGRRSPELSRHAAARHVGVADQTARPPIKCATCDAMVIPPCRACRLGRLLAVCRPAPLQRGYVCDGSLRIDLRGEERQRYLRLKRQKDAQFSASGGEPQELWDSMEPTDAQLRQIEVEERQGRLAPGANETHEARPALAVLEKKSIPTVPDTTVGAH